LTFQPYTKEYIHISHYWT